MSARPANIIRHKMTRAFTALANDIVNDDRLELDEKGLLWWFLSLPEDWEVVPIHVRKRHRLGRQKYHRMMKSLRTAGYAELQVERASDGTIACIRYVITDQPAIPASGDGSGIPDGRVCEIEDAELEAADDPEETEDHPRPENPYSGSTDSGLPAPRQSNKDLQNTPLPPKPPPVAAPPFRSLCAKWPGDRIVSASAAERRYLRLSEDRRQQAFDGVERYLAETRGKGWKICDLQTYLRDRRWESVKAGPPAACSTAAPGSPQAARWLAYWEAIGERTGSRREQLRQGKPITTTAEWPPPLPLDTKKAG